MVRTAQRQIFITRRPFRHAFNSRYYAAKVEDRLSPANALSSIASKTGIQVPRTVATLSFSHVRSMKRMERGKLPLAQELGSDEDFDPSQVDQVYSLPNLFLNQPFFFSLLGARCKAGLCAWKLPSLAVAPP